MTSPEARISRQQIGTTGTYISGGNMAGSPMAGKLIGEILDYLGVEKEYSRGGIRRRWMCAPPGSRVPVADAAAHWRKRD